MEFVAMVRGVFGVVVVVGNVLLGCSVGLQFVSFLPISQASCWSPEKCWGCFSDLSDIFCHLNFDSAATIFAVFHELRGTAWLFFPHHCKGRTRTWGSCLPVDSFFGSSCIQPHICKRGCHWRWKSQGREKRSSYLCLASSSVVSTMVTEVTTLARLGM